MSGEASAADGIVGPDVMVASSATMVDGEIDEGPVLVSPKGEGGEPDDRVGRYLVIGELGRGGMGVVLEAYDETLDRKVALKLLHPDLGAHHAKRLLREAQALARLSHPNVVGVYEVGEVDGQSFIAMELVEGQSLRDWHRTPRSWREVIDVYLQAGRGLVAAHAEGLVHRDFKPSNCLIDQEGRVRVLDFGLAGDVEALQREAAERAAEPKDDAKESTSSSTSPSVRTSRDTLAFARRSALLEPLTRVGAVLGTLAYMSPEQLRGEVVDAKSDQYSFCVSMYQALHGELPPQGKGMSLSADASSSVVAPTGRRVPGRLRRVVLRGMANDPDERWPSVEALLRELERYGTVPWLRWGLLGLLLANVGLAAAVWGGAFDDLPEPVCQGAQQRMAGIWDAPRREQVQTAILATGLPYARDTLASVDGRLSQYADIWVERHTAACEATRVHAEQSEATLERRMQCLARRRAALGQVVTLLAKADKQVVEQAVRVTAGLPPLARCDDVDALVAELPPPEDPAVERRVAALRQELDHSRTLRKAGKFEQSREGLEPVVQEARDLGYEPLLAEALLEQGELEQAVGYYEEAERDLQAALTTALRVGHDDVAAEASSSLTFVIGAMLARIDAGRLLGATAEALARHRDPGGPMEADALINLGQALAKHGDHAAAEGHYLRALEIFRASEQVEPYQMLAALGGLRGVLRQQRRWAEAESVAEEALALIERELGARHPTMVHHLANKSAVLIDQGNRGDAELLLRRALTIATEALPPEHPTVALTHSNLGATLLQQGKNLEAESELRQALAIWTKVHDAEHDVVAGVQANLGVALRGQGRPAQAEDHYRQALAHYRKVFDDAHPKVVTVRLNLGTLLRGQGRHDDAEEQYERVRLAVEAKHGPGHPDVARALSSTGVLRFEQGRYQDAVALYQRALAIFEKVYPADPPSPRVARVACALGRAQHRLGRLETARAQLERALTIQREASVREIDLARTEQSLAAVLWDEGGDDEQQRALELAEQALARLGQGSQGAEPLRAELEQWLMARR